ncbi:MAG: CYTH domain-containing protein [Desulfuromonadaceae bacterium]|nr:CYTH domain-containing protein [Desulfuromonadaceae bacterium]
MKLEIERKFLIRSDAWRRNVLRKDLLRQGYLAVDQQKVIRVRVASGRGILTIKQASTGIVRREFEYDIPVEEASLMVDEMSRGFVVEKIRHRVGHGDRVWEIDEFLKENSGLVVAEIELEGEEQVFEFPLWLGREVTTDHRFSNAALSCRPFSLWPDRDAFIG